MRAQPGYRGCATSSEQTSVHLSSEREKKLHFRRFASIGDLTSKASQSMVNSDLEIFNSPKQESNVRDMRTFL